MTQAGDMQVFGLFCFLPLATGIAVFVFFFRLRQHKQPFRWSRLLLGNVLIFLLVGSTAVLCGEIYYRFFCDTTDSFGLSKITMRWFSRHFHNNRLGFRDSVEYRPEVPAGKRRVTFLGDSFTVGHGIADVEDRFANRVRAALPQCDVHVFANPGWDTRDHTLVVGGLAGDRFQLDLVVLVYCLNDVTDIVPEWQEIERRIYQPHWPRFFVEHSYLINTWHYRRKAAQDPDVANYFQFVRDNYDGPVWQQQRGRLIALRDTVEQFSGRLVVVTFPFVHALGPDYAYRQVHQQLGRFWDDLGVQHLDLLPAFESCRAADMVINRYDAHPNEKAHAVAADAIAEFLRQQLSATAPEQADDGQADGR